MTVRSIKLTVDSNLENSALVRAALRGLCAYVELDSRYLDCIELAVSEAVNNCIEHAYLSQPGHEVAVECSVHTDYLKFVVSDTGKAMPLHHLEEASSAVLAIDPDRPDGLRCSGRGLALIKESMERVEYFSDGGCNRLLMIKRLGRANVGS